jgi:hypothetical protein
MDDSSVLPSEFLTLIKDPAPISRQKMEDNEFIRLYRGYTAEDIADWVNCHSYDDGYMIYLCFPD